MKQLELSVISAAFEFNVVCPATLQIYNCEAENSSVIAVIKEENHKKI